MREGNPLEVRQHMGDGKPETGWIRTNLVFDARSMSCIWHGQADRPGEYSHFDAYWSSSHELLTLSMPACQQ